MRRLILAVAAVAAVTAAYTRFVPANPTTVALTFLVCILLFATAWGIWEAMAASVAAVLCLNFFFLPPVGALTISDPQNWVALFVFLLTAVVTSQLSARARQRAVDALARQRDLERLYALSRALLLAERPAAIPGVIARHIADAFELRAVALFDLRTGLVSHGGPEDLPGVEDRLREVARQSVPIHDPSGLVITTIRLGGAPIGSLALDAGALTDTVLQSIANLAAIALERTRGQEATARAEAARESGELRAAVLDAVAHEFKTPLTTLKAAADGLRAPIAPEARDRELAEIVAEEVDRLDGVVTDAVQMLRVEAGGFAVERERHDVGRLVASVCDGLRSRLDGREVHTSIPDGLTVEADGELLRLALRQLVDNAAKYSPAGTPIDIAASGGGAGTQFSVRNAGSTIPDGEQPHVFDRFYRGLHARLVPGTGMGLAIVRQIADAHGGSVVVESSPSAGTTFILTLPAGEAPA